VTDPRIYKPVSTQYLILGMLKTLYPDQFDKAVKALKAKNEMFSKVNGTEEVFELLEQNKPVVWPLRAIHEKERQDFMKIRQKYLIPGYS